MEEWLNMFNAKMKKENRNVIFFLDNATCHPKVTLSNVNIAWFPANATRVLQPLDMGTFKSHYRQFLFQSLFLNIEEADSSYALARSVSVLDAANWIGWAVMNIKAETVKKCFAKTGFGESDVADNLEEASENIAAISSLCRGKELSCDTKDFVQSDDHLATDYSFEPATALLAVTNTQNEDVEDEEEEAEGEEAAGEQDISTKICTNEQALHCIREVMQFAIYSNSSSFIELYCIQLRTAFKKTLTQKSGNKFLCWNSGRNLNGLYIGNV
jgi:hypothetical protein